MTAKERVYRVTATYSWGTKQRRYLTKGSALQAAKRLTEGYERAVPGDFGQLDTEQVEPAQCVQLEESTPFTWPERALE